MRKSHHGQSRGRKFRGCSSAGRVREWHSRGHGFDPHHLHPIGSKHTIRLGNCKSRTSSDRGFSSNFSLVVSVDLRTVFTFTLCKGSTTTVGPFAFLLHFCVFDPLQHNGGCTAKIGLSCNTTCVLCCRTGTRRHWVPQEHLAARRRRKS